MDIGKQIRLLRKQKKITLAELSHKSGVALASLSRIETGRMSGTIDSHVKVAEALGVGLPHLYRLAELEERKSSIEISTDEKQERKIFVNNEKVSVELLARDIGEKKMMPTVVRLKVGGQSQVEKTEVGIEKFYFVVEGRIDFKVEQDLYHLKKGDSLYLDSSLSHLLENVGDLEASCLCVTSPS